MEVTVKISLQDNLNNAISSRDEELPVFILIMTHRDTVLGLCALLYPHTPQLHPQRVADDRSDVRYSPEKDSPHGTILFVGLFYGGRQCACVGGFLLLQAAIF